jgi:hypothetical protein
MQSTIATEQVLLEKSRTDFELKADGAIVAKLDEVSDHYLKEVQDSVDCIKSEEETASELRGQMQTLHTEGRRIVEAVASRAVAKDYQRNARNKSAAGWTWDFAGLVIGSVSLTLLLVHLFKSNAETISTELALTRLAVSIAGLGLAGLCFHRAGGNHMESRRSKRADIRVSTVRAFIANQDIEFQDTIVEGMADRIYLQDLLDSDESKYDSTLFESVRARIRARRAEELAVETG